MSDIGLSRRTSKEIVAARIRELILSGEWAPGTRLIVPQLARTFDVSPTPAREAIQLLEATGFVTTVPYRGAQVAELDADDCEEIYALRDALERLATRRATPTITDDRVEEIRAHLETMRRAAADSDPDAFVAADRELHRVHYDAEHDGRLWQRIMDLRHSSERYTRFAYQNKPGYMDRSLRWHDALVAGIAARDVAATEATISDMLHRVADDARALLDSGAFGHRSS